MDLANSNLPPVITYSDEKSNSGISHKPSVKSYATRVFQESTVGIVSSILTTHSKYRRFFKVFFSALCIAGFIYHCVTFLNHVFEYPDVMDIHNDRSETYDMPAYTYCSNNPIKRSAFCKRYPEHCEKPSETFCKKYTSYCGVNATHVPKKKYYTRLPRGYPYELILEVGSKPNVLNINGSTIRTHKGKEKAVEISGPYLRSSGDLEAVKACYDIHSLIEINKQPLQHLRDTMSAFDEMFQFIVNETEMMDPESIPGVYFSVHSPFETANPLEKGIFMKGGRTYDIHVEMQEELLLKAPFQSNCMDYEEFLRKENRTGPRTKKTCRDKCALDFTLLQDQCVSIHNNYPHKQAICRDGNSSDGTTKAPKTEDTQAQLLHSKCESNCLDECRSSKYTTDRYVHFRVEFFELEEQHRHIRVEIFMSDDEVKVLHHSPKYETVDVISSIGGFMGCWLGIALMDILDVFGSIISVGRFAFRKKLNKENRKAFVHVVQNPSS